MPIDDLPDNPHSINLTALLRHQLARVDPDMKGTWAQRQIEAWTLEAMAGNMRALREILDRLEVKR